MIKWGPVRGNIIDGRLSGALNRAGAWTGAAEGGGKKNTMPRAIDWGGAGDLGGGQLVAGLLSPSNELQEWMGTGGDPRLRDRREEGGKVEAVRCQVGGSSMVQADLTVGRGQGAACQTPRTWHTGDRDEVTIFQIPTVQA